MEPFENIKTLPTHWELVPLGTVIRTQSCDANLIKGKQASAPGHGLFPAYSASGQDVWTTKAHHEGDAIIVSAVGARCGKCFRAAGQWSAVANTHIVWPDRTKVDPDFLWRLVNDESFWMRGQSAQPYVQVSATKPKLIPLPPLPEQQRIAQVLSTVQSAIEQQERLIRTTTELKQALMQKLFTEGLRGEAQKETEIGMVPESWEVVPLASVTKIERGKFSHRPRNDPRFYDGPYPFVQTGDVANCDGYVRSHSQSLNEAGLEVSRMFPAGTILITIAANIGFTGILTYPAACPDSLIGLTCGPKVQTEYLNYYLMTQQPIMDRLAPRGTQKNINIEFLKPWPVVLPPLDDQAAIADALMAVENRTRTAQGKRNTLQDLFRTLLHELMTGKVRVGNLMQ
jgi:type I restriction enzyme S subunit